jgi:hypothetical protein
LFFHFLVKVGMYSGSPTVRGRAFSFSSVFKGFGISVVIQPLVTWLYNQCLLVFKLIFYGSCGTGYTTETTVVIQPSNLR